MELSYFRDGADKGLVCEAGSPHFFLSNSWFHLSLGGLRSEEEYIERRN